jgi:hypothetical protein
MKTAVKKSAKKLAKKKKPSKLLKKAAKASPDTVATMAKGLADLPPFNFSPRGGGKLYIHSQKWRKGYEERQAANASRKARIKGW